MMLVLNSVCFAANVLNFFMTGEPLALLFMFVSGALVYLGLRVER